MKKTSFIAMFLALLCSFSAIIPPAIHAANFDLTNEVTPRAEICLSASPDFSISGGKAIVSLSYNTNPSLFSSAVLIVKIERNTFADIWTTVELGNFGEEWIATASNASHTFSNSFRIADSGRYRAIFTLKIFGTSGKFEEIERTLEYTY